MKLLASQGETMPEILKSIFHVLCALVGIGLVVILGIGFKTMKNILDEMDKGE